MQFTPGMARDRPLRRDRPQLLDLHLWLKRRVPPAPPQRGWLTRPASVFASISVRGSKRRAPRPCPEVLSSSPEIRTRDPRRLRHEHVISENNSHYGSSEAPLTDSGCSGIAPTAAASARAAVFIWTVMLII
eukprot:2315172-Pyramimonas_sp.AAC.1